MEKYRNCKHCLKPITLIPSAEVRAKRFGGKASDYRDMFDTHASCAIKARSKEARELMRKQRGIYSIPSVHDKSK